MVLTPKKFNAGSVGLVKAVGNPNAATDEPELVCREKELDPSIEEEIKDGFFELK